MRIYGELLKALPTAWLSAHILCRISSPQHASTCLSGWVNIQQALQLLTGQAPSLHHQLDELWSQQSQRFHGAFTQSSQHAYITQLSQLQHSLPVLIELVTEVRHDCSFPLLDNLSFHEGVALSVQLLLLHHQASAAVQQLLSDATQQMPARPAVVVVWDTVMTAVQVSRLANKPMFWHVSQQAQ